MKNFKKIFSFFVSSMIFILSSFGTVTAEESYLKFFELKAQKNYHSVELYKNFTSSFSKKIQNNIEYVQYPEEYAGAYIDDNCILHIKVTGNSKKEKSINKNKFIKIMKKSSCKDVVSNGDVIIESAENSLSTLLNIQKKLDDVMEKYKISSTYTNEEDNILEIELLDMSKKKSILKHLNDNYEGFNEKSVHFSKGYEIVPTANNTKSNALAGSTASAGSSCATLGFNAYDPVNKKYGVVTAAHFATKGTMIKNSKDKNIGKSSKRKYGGSLDAAFVPFGKGISKSKKIYRLSSPDDTLTGYFKNSELVTGMMVTKVGTTTRVTYGKILTVSHNVYDGKNHITDQVKISNKQLPGDSGGPVFFSMIGPVKKGSVRTNRLVGIATFTDKNKNGYVSKAQTILKEFKLTLNY